MTPRSLLYTSALQPERFAKLAACGAQMGVLDLEDGVPAALKDTARGHLAVHFAQHHDAGAWAIRINPVDTRDGLHDMLLLDALPHWPDALVLSMVRSSSDVTHVRAWLNDFQRASVPQLYVTVETPDALMDIDAIARAADGLIFGSADYCAALNMPIGGGEKLLFARCAIVNAAARHGIPAFDTACFRVDAGDVLLEEAMHARMLGFSGKSAVHPGQVETINRVFSPSAQEREQARRLVGAYEAAGQGVVRMDAGMVGPPFYKLAKRLLQTQD